MKTNKTPVIYKEFLFLGFFLRWIDRHPKTALILLWLHGLALVFTVFNYHFTTNF